ncbi:DUF1998 domain-containing protein [Fusibacter ferrireducens]|uniref:DUF1998 domain-containing protein n=1 Tax=Fusibacter ferrireducens TaxID=2785058 RepID=A0ABR9ZZX7_9FIRM|nr:DUF1998 domain-containing protein [Fusibacter ferrireducens]MBF4695994.1 DUF1998 domain-containing protein [Fusibacter ferrireducens]
MNDKRLVLKKGYKLRSSQAISPFGVGAVVDFKKQSLMAASTQFWNIDKCREIHDERLERVLNVDTFYIPENLDVDEYYGFPFVNFPEWYFCPSCRKFKPISEWEREFLIKPQNKKAEAMLEPKCVTCKNVDLVPARIVCVCKEGHITDFPWVAWVHYKSNKTDKQICTDKPQLKISTLGSTTGLEGIRVECEHCKASASLQGSFKKGVFKEIISNLNKLGKEDLANNFKCDGNMPWSLSKEKCELEEELVVVQRGASNIHYSKVISSIVIPPYSNKLSQDVEKNRTYREIVRDIEDLDENETCEDFLNDKNVKRRIKRIAEDLRFDLDEVTKIIYRKLIKNESNCYIELIYKAEEYKAMTGQIEIENLLESDFKLKNTDIEMYGLDFLAQVVLVEKLREVRALVGFTRILPPDSKHFNENGDSQEAKLVSTKQKNWYPAYEVRGEGLFIEFDFDKLSKWAKNPDVINRANILHTRKDSQIKLRGDKARNISPEFIALHTFAHLLIKQLSFDCGYSSASLRERIYFNNDENTIKMCGILIYTASGDAEGTLGGLTRQGYPDRLPQIILKALLNASWCSNDPVCIESNGQGRDSLNLASCYSCSLVSETSCEEFNSLLDRGLLIGTLDNKKIGYLESLVD